MFWKSQDVVPPVYLRPMVIAMVAEPVKIVLNGEHGVHEIWREVEVRGGASRDSRSRSILARRVHMAKPDPFGVE